MFDVNDQMTVKEAAKYLDMDYTELIILVRHGSIPSKKFGKQYSLHKSDIDDFKNKSNINKDN